MSTFVIKILFDGSFKNFQPLFPLDVINFRLVVEDSWLLTFALMDASDPEKILKKLTSNGFFSIGTRCWPKFVINTSTKPRAFEFLSWTSHVEFKNNLFRGSSSLGAQSVYHWVHTRLDSRTWTIVLDRDHDVGQPVSPERVSTYRNIFTIRFFSLVFLQFVAGTKCVSPEYLLEIIAFLSTRAKQNDRKKNNYDVILQRRRKLSHVHTWKFNAVTAQL